MRNISYFKIGIFFLFSIFVGVGAVFWIGSAGLFQDRDIYVTFIDTSAEGLSPGSSVEYLGLSVGKVTNIELVAGERMVKITISFREEFEVKEWMAVQLKMKSITGAKYVAIVKAPENLEKVTPEIDFEVKHPVLPSVPGQIEQIVSTLETIYKQTQDIDLSGLITEWRQVAEQAGSILEGGELEKTLQHFRSVSRRLENVTQSLSGSESAREWQQAFENMKGAAQSARTAARRLENQLAKVPSGKIADITGQTETTLTTIENAADSTDVQIDETMRLIRQNLQQVDQVLAEFKKLARSLRQQPGRILSQPPQQEPFER